MRWGAVFLVCVALAAAGCAVQQSDQRLEEQRRWQRVRERCRGEVLLATEIRYTLPEDPRLTLRKENQRTAKTLAIAADTAAEAVVEIRLGGTPETEAKPDTPDISTAKPQTAGRRARGTGIIIDPAGLILTNDHVVCGTGPLSVVMHDGAIYEAHRVARDPRRDLAVIRIQARGLPTLAPRATPVPAAGTPVVALGAVTESGQSSARTGRIRRREATLQGQLDPAQRSYYGHLIETTAPIEPGFSGGPLLDEHGRFVGIIVAVARDQDEGHPLGYAIPLNGRTRQIIARLAAGRAVQHAYLGAYVRDGPRKKTEDQHYGALIDEACPDAPAAEAGLRPGDLLVEFRGVRIRNADHLVRLVDASPIDTPVEIRCSRNGRLHTAIARLRPRPQ